MRLHRSHRACRGLVALTAASFLATAIDLALLPPAAHAADAREELTRAEDYFLVADFTTALQKVNALLDSGELTGTTLRDAWVLKAKCEVGLAHRRSAVDAFCQVLRIEPSWRPDPDLYTKDELDVFEEARSTCGAAPPPQETKQPTKPIEKGTTQPSAGKPWYKKPVVLAVGGALVVGGVVAAVSGGGDDGGAADLPGFPNPPQ